MGVKTFLITQEVIYHAKSKLKNQLHVIFGENRGYVNKKERFNKQVISKPGKQINAL